MCCSAGSTILSSLNSGLRWCITDNPHSHVYLTLPHVWVITLNCHYMHVCTHVHTHARIHAYTHTHLPRCTRQCRLLFTLQTHELIITTPNSTNNIHKDIYPFPCRITKMFMYHTHTLSTCGPVLTLSVSDASQHITAHHSTSQPWCPLEPSTGHVERCQGNPTDEQDPNDNRGVHRNESQLGLGVGSA